MGSEYGIDVSWQNVIEDGLKVLRSRWTVQDLECAMRTDVASGFADDESTARDCAELVAERLAGRDVRGELAQYREAAQKLVAAQRDGGERMRLAMRRFSELLAPEPDTQWSEPLEEARAELAALRAQVEALAASYGRAQWSAIENDTRGRLSVAYAHAEKRIRALLTPEAK